LDVVIYELRIRGEGLSIFFATNFGVRLDASKHDFAASVGACDLLFSHNS